MKYAQSRTKLSNSILHAPPEPIKFFLFLAVLFALSIAAIPASTAFNCQSCSGGSGDPSPDACDPKCSSPIIMDTEGEGFHLTSASAGVAFDISGTGQPVQIAWTDSHFHNAFLALPGSDGLVHNGKQLFGNFTPQPESPHPNGFLALAEFDKPQNGGNGDGIIDKTDSIFSRLPANVTTPQKLHRNGQPMLAWWTAVRRPRNVGKRYRSTGRRW